MKRISYKQSQPQTGGSNRLVVKRKSCYEDDEEREIQATRMEFQQMTIDKPVDKS
jgi:hypothetical protein